MSDSTAVEIPEVAPKIYKAMAGVEAAITEHGQDKILRHLVKLRASQINRCAFCIKMHTEEARRDGDTSERLDRVIVWRHVDDFSEKEKAALAWTEALTYMAPDTDYAPLRAELKRHFTDEEIAGLTSSVAMINLWNRLKVSNH